MERNIPVPAESLRTIARAAVDEAREEREEGRRSLARSLEEEAGTAFSRLDGKDGEFVSVPASTVSRLTAFGGPNWRHRDAATVFLEQYGIWSSEE